MDARPAQLKILILEDVATDAELIERALRKGGLHFTTQKADRRQAFEAALSASAPDLVLSDYNLPDMTGLTALEITNRQRPPIPLIVVTGALSDAAAAELLRSGARDYVLKDRLARLPDAVRRVLFEDEAARARAAAEAALKLSEARYRNIVETSRDWIWETDANGDFTFSSSRVREIVGYEASELIGKSYASLLSPADAALFEQFLPTLAENRTPPGLIEGAVISKGGATVELEATIERILTPGGAFAGLRGIARDVTQRKLAERKIREEEARFRALVEQEVVGIFIVDDQGRIAYVNPKFADQLGYAVDELIGMPMAERFARSGRTDALGHLKRQLSGATATAKLTTYFERKDGGRMDVLLQSARAEVDGQAAIMGVAVDISDLKRAEERLRASEEEFRLLVEWAPEAIVLYDVESKRYSAVNRQAEALFGCGREALLESGPQPFYLPDQPDGRPVAESFARHMASAMHGGETVFERRIRSAKGGEALCEVRLVQIPTAKGPMVRASFVDITERRQAEAARQLQGAVISAVQESAIDGILVVDDQGRVVTHNQRFAEMLRVPPEAFESGDDAPVLKCALDLAADPEAFMKRVAELYAQPDVTGSDEVVFKDGRIVDRFSAPVRLADGTHVGRVWFFRDITGRRAAEKAQAMQAALISAVQETSLDGIIVLDEKGKILAHNQRFAEIMNIPPEAFASGDEGAVMQIGLQMAADAAAAAKGIFDLRDQPDASTRQEVPFADGRTFDTFSAPVRLADGSHAGRVWFFRDITEHKMAEAARVRLTAVLAAVQETSLDGILVVDGKGGLVTRNARFAEIMQLPDEAFASGREEPVFKAALRLLADPETLGRHVAELYARPDATSQEEVLLKDGRTLENFSTPVRLSDGGDVGRVWYFRDVTDAKNAAAELRESEERFRAVSSAALDAVIMIDDAGKITLWNGAAQRTFGYTAEEAAGRDLHELLAPARYLDAYKAAWPRFAQSGEGDVIGEVRTLEGRRKDGTEFPFELSLSAIKLRGHWHGVGILRDITERQAIEQKLRDDEARFRGLVEQEVAGIYIIGQDGTVAYVNPAFASKLGYPAEDMVGQPFLQFVADEDKEAIVQNVMGQLAGGPPAPQVEVALNAKDGHLVHFLGHGVIATYEGKPAAIGVLVDITDRKVSEQKLRDDEARFRALVEQEIAGIYIIGPGARVKFINKAFAQMFGYTVDEIVGRPFVDFVAESDREMIAKRYLAEMAGERQMAPIVLSLKRKGGGQIEALVHSRFATFEREPASIGVMLDVTETRRAERQIREQEARFRALVEQEIAGVFILGGAGIVEYLNPAWPPLLGYTMDEILSRPFLDFVAEDRRAELVVTFASLVSGEVGRAQVATELTRKGGGRMDVLAHAARTVLDGKPVVVGVMLDISEQKQAERTLERLNRTLLTLSAGNEALVRATGEEELLSSMCGVLIERGGYKMAWVGVPESNEQRTVAPVASAGDDTGYLKSVTITWAEADPLGRGVTGESIRTGQAQTSQDLAADPRMAPWLAEAERRGFASSAAFPLLEKDRVFATLTLYSAEVDAFSADEMKLLQELVNDAAYGIMALRTRAERESALQRLRTSLEATVSVLASATELRDPYTAGHQHRVGQLASAIARELKLPEDQVQGISLAGIIHDIGKIVVPAELLSKPGKLTPLEFQLIQTHAQTGYDVVKDVAFPWPIATAILQHHERLDGSGYPNRLKAGEIIQEAKILAVADVVEAMMSNRPYRSALGIDAALAEIESGKGRIYDPAAVEACLRLFREQDFKVA